MTKKLLRASIIYCCVILLGIAQAASPKENTKSLARPQSPVGSVKVNSFLQQVLTTSSLKDLSNEFQRVQFSKTEINQLKKKLRENDYKYKINKLVQKEKKKKQTKTFTKVAKSNRPSKASTPKESYQQRKVQANRQVKVKLKRLRASTKRKQMSSLKVQGVRKLASNDIMMMRRFTSSGEFSPTITSLRPEAGTAGQRIAISGVNFGSNQGRVALIIGRSTPARGNLMYAHVNNWTPNQITITLPNIIQPLVGESIKNGIIWVKLADSELGPYHNYRFQPNLTMLRPTVTRVEPEPISPHSNILIEGSNFLTEHKPTVQIVGMREGSISGEANIIVAEYDDNYIFAHGGDSLGSAISAEAGGVILKVKNHLGLEVTRAISLERRRLRQTLSRVQAHRVQCEDWQADRPSIFCLAGYRQIFTGPNLGTCSGWDVVNYTVRVLDEGGSSGYTFKREPFGSSPNYEIEVWANAYSWIELEVNIELEGPEGTFCW